MCWKCSWPWLSQVLNRMACIIPANTRGESMIGRLNHVAIAVADIARAADVYRRTLGAEVSPAAPQPEHGVTTVFITLPNAKIELIEPLGDASPITKFLPRNPEGG